MGSSVPYGYRLLASTVDEIAESTSEKLFGCIPRTNDIKDGFLDITFAEFARATDRAAWWMEGLLGKSTTFETLAYLGPSDLRYFILIIAASKVGYKLFLPSPRNSLEGQVNLFNKTSCNILITTPSTKVKEYLDAHPMRLVYVPELDDLLAPGAMPRYKFSKTFQEAKDEPFLVLHTSGSSGLPKPVFLPQSWVCGPDAHQRLESHDGFGPMLNTLAGQRMFCCLPPFHGAGIVFGLLASVFVNSVSIWAPNNRPLSASLVEEMLCAVKIDVVFTAPSILEEMTQSPEALKKLSNLKSACYGGGPLSCHAGDILSKKITVINTMGLTETALIPFYKSALEDWEYFHHNPNLKGLEFRPRGEELYELVIVRHPSTDPYHSTFSTFPELTELALKDLYSKHPTKPNHWLYVGRADDVVVLSNGEKLSPVAMESTLRDHPSVNGALIVGQGKFSTAAIIELRPDVAQMMRTAEDQASLVESLWPYVVAANEKAPAHAQLAKDKIMIAPAEKQFLRAGKGTVQRGATVKLFEHEIEELYEQNKGDSLLDLPQFDLGQDIPSLQQNLLEIIDMATGVRLTGHDQDFFSSGMDSLQVMKLTKHLKSATVGDAALQAKINTRIIYTNPTLVSLASALKKVGHGATGMINGSKSVETREMKMQELLQKYLKHLPAPTERTSRSSHDALTVILTGSTGSLGSYLLDTLANCPTVARIYCLNRRADAEYLQAKTNLERGLTSIWGTKIVFLQVDLSKTQLGLSGNLYEHLVEETSVIIHNQWQVDFNLSLSSFEPHIAGVSNLIKLSSASRNSPPIFFTSSIGAVGNWHQKHPNERVPEIAIDDPCVSEHQGYSESKWISERLLDAAGKKCGVSTAICRVGQIAGPVEKGIKGKWNTQEWLPSIIASSKYLGAIPSSLGSMDDVSWTPADTLSKILVELMLRDQELEETWTKFYHLDNPKSCKWSSLVPMVPEYFRISCLDKTPENTNSEMEERILEVVSFSKWLVQLKESGKEKDVDLTKNPGLKLLEFYQSLDNSSGLGSNVLVSRLATTKACKGSETMRNLKAVDGAWMRLWLDQWHL